MSGLQKIKSKNHKSPGRGASAKHLWRKQFRIDDDRFATVGLGLLAEKTAFETSGHIDHLLEVRVNGIHSRKTKRHKPMRLVPIPALVGELLSKQYLLVPDGTKHVFRNRRRNTNPATSAKKNVVSAGHQIWTNFWNSLRASCDTDMMDEFGLRKACMWVGNSPTVAMKNYSLLNHTEFLDDGEAKKSDYNSAEAHARNAGISAQKNADTLKPGICVHNSSQSDPEGARTLNLRIDSPMR